MCVRRLGQLCAHAHAVSTVTRERFKQPVFCRLDTADSREYRHVLLRQFCLPSHFPFDQKVEPAWSTAASAVHLVNKLSPQRTAEIHYWVSTFWTLLDIDAPHDAICVALHKYLQKAALAV